MACRKCHFNTCRCQDLKEGFSETIVTGGAGWPRLSDAAGVHPSQIPEAMEEAKKLGVRIEFDSSGAAKFENYAHQKQYCRAIGLTDIGKREITIPKYKTMSERSLDAAPRRNRPGGHAMMQPHGRRN